MTTDSELRDQAVAKLKETTVGYLNAHWKTPPAGSKWAEGLALLQQIGQPATSGLSLYVMGGNLASCAHLDDATYQVVIGDWTDAALLAKCAAPETYAYTVVANTPGADPAAYNVLDETGAAQSVAEYVERCQQLVSQNPGLKGIFIDNLLPGQTRPGLLAALQSVHAQLDDVKLAANVGGFVSGDGGSDTGDVWIGWAEQVAPYLDRLMLENWMTPSNVEPPTKVRLRGAAWDENYDAWLRCVAVAPGKLMAVTYGPASFGVYGRAAMLLAPDANPGNVFFNDPGGVGPDPYGAAWQADPASATIDPVAGTATL